VLTLLRTYVDMIALRRGPDAVPASWVVMTVAVVLLLVSSYAAMALVDGVNGENPLMTFAGYGLGICFYASVVYISGYSRRIMQAISAIIACGAIITLLFVAEYVLVAPLFGEKIAGLLATLIIFWAVPVEGHIIARTIQQHWFVGITIAMAAFILQLGFHSAFSARV